MGHGDIVSALAPSPVGGQPRQNHFFGLSFWFMQGEHRAARVSQHFVDGAVAGEVLEDVALGGAENDEGGVEVSGLGQDLDGRISMNDMGLDRN